MNINKCSAVLTKSALNAKREKKFTLGAISYRCVCEFAIVEEEDKYHGPLFLACVDSKRVQGSGLCLDGDVALGWDHC